MSESHAPNLDCLCHGIADHSYAFTFTGRDLSGWGFEATVSLNGTTHRMPAWVTHGTAGKVTMTIPMDVANAFQGEIEQGTLTGIRPDGSETLMARLIVNGLRQP